MAEKRKVLIVDDHPVLRRGLAMLINAESDLAVCAEAQDSAEAMAALAGQEPDIVLLDLVLRNESGLDLIAVMRAASPRLPILVISMHEESLYAERAIRAGARGFITKHAAEEKIVSAVRAVLSGEIYLDGKYAARLLGLRLLGAEEADSTLGRLSNRELEVFRHMGRGQRPTQIARLLHLSVRTIETHQANIKDKLGLETAAALYEYAIAWSRESRV
jgi:DNA-binding NarL/FixJ family response regulator